MAQRTNWPYQTLLDYMGYRFLRNGYIPVCLLNMNVDFFVIAYTVSSADLIMSIRKSGLCIQHPFNGVIGKCIPPPERINLRTYRTDVNKEISEMLRWEDCAKQGACVINVNLI